MYCKYTFDNIYTIARVDIDRKPPQIELIKIDNKEDDIKLQIKVIEKNILKNNFDKKNIKILIDKEEVTPKIYEITQIEKSNEFITYEIKLGGLVGKGMLKIQINAGIIKDKYNNINELNILETNIKINNK